MPELPEVQTIVEDLIAAGIEGAAITEATVYWPRTVATPDFVRGIRGQRIRHVGRRGKYLVFELESPARMLVHLRMSGRLHLRPGPSTPDPYDRVVFTLSDGRQLCLHDPRKFGRIHLLEDADRVLGALGVEPLDEAFTPGVLSDLLRRRRRRLKPLLLDQTLIAGLGNIYVDEALWESALHPCRISATLSAEETERLYDAIRLVLARGIANRGTSLGKGRSNFASIAHRRGENVHALRVFRRDGLPCPRCGAAITRLIVAQRGTHICPRCQKGD
ncbi:MAG TPA: bifunctional DNA-formamidopyrimidine glycosylase/DNA-(apurinic or apyrimidinic site) lyase [Deltaproteobacteria bacterium]|nr:bifunctional DNA-formamidopyrimidine glycosylase/DNA-(apurinic or apyrimidinic site) lyase [Deltaproteobacteria bacterium]